MSGLGACFSSSLPSLPLLGLLLLLEVSPQESALSPLWATSGDHKLPLPGRSAYLCSLGSGSPSSVTPHFLLPSSSHLFSSYWVTPASFLPISFPVWLAQSFLLLSLVKPTQALPKGGSQRPVWCVIDSFKKTVMGAMGYRQAQSLIRPVCPQGSCHNSLLFLQEVFTYFSHQRLWWSSLGCSRFQQCLFTVGICKWAMVCSVTRLCDCCPLLAVFHRSWLRSFGSQGHHCFGFLVPCLLASFLLPCSVLLVYGCLLLKTGNAGPYFKPMTPIK